jgi:hypothetical protein
MRSQTTKKRQASRPSVSTLSTDILSGSYDAGTQTGTLILDVRGDLDLKGQTVVAKQMNVKLEVIEVDVGGTTKLGIRLTLSD